VAILWQKKINGCRYQVRSAGRTRRLYTNGVCHSEFNPDKVITGSIWDLLVLPAFFYGAGRVQRVLLLGVGGGASILQLHHLLATESITGIDWDAVHLELAQRFFNIDSVPARLCRSDARDWLERYSGPPFDMIIDDLFTNQGKEPVRAFAADADWFNLVLGSLSDHGHLVMNFGSGEEFRASAYFTRPAVSRQFRCAFRLSHPFLDNVVGAFMRTQTRSGVLRANIRAHPILGRALACRQLRYRIRQVTGNTV